VSNPQFSGLAQPGPPQPAGQRLLAIVLAIIGILAAVLGLLYIIAGTSLPTMLEGSSHHGHHAVRAAISFIVAAACFFGAWLASRQRSAGRS
jgi:hypothetical protein